MESLESEGSRELLVQSGQRDRPGLLTSTSKKPQPQWLLARSTTSPLTVKLVMWCSVEDVEPSGRTLKLVM